MKLKQIFNKYRNLKSYFHRKIICKGYPEVFNIELTNSCPMSCVMCPRRFMKRKVGFMKFELFKKMIDQLNGYTYAIWLHHFGESLLHPKLKQMIGYAKLKKIKSQLSINPVLLTKTNIKKIKDLDYLHISLDGTNEETYKKLRGKNADYEQAVSYIKNFLKLKKRPYTTVAIIKLKETEKELEDFKKQWKDSGINNIEIKEFTTWDGSKKEITSLASDQQFSEAHKKNLQYPCLRPWHRFTVLWDGKVVPCCYDYDAKYVIGSVNEESIKEIWNNKKMQELRRTLTDADFTANKLCASCIEGEGAPPSRIYPLDIVRKLFELKPNKIITYFFKRST